MAPFQPPLNRPRPMALQPQLQSQMNTGWRDAYMPFQRETQRPSIPGFYISSPQDITPRDVPMDGSISFFPSNDLSYIVIKQWTGNGTIADARYILEPSPASAQEQQIQKSVESKQVQDSEPTAEVPESTEIVEVVSAALNEQTQRLTAAFSQIGLAFNTLQQKLDSITPIFPSPESLEPITEDFSKTGLKNPEPVENSKPVSRPKTSKEPKEDEKL